MTAVAWLNEKKAKHMIAAAARDSLANWTSVTKQGLTQTRTHSLATFSRQTAPIRDATGNLTKAAIPGGTNQQWYSYDARNRLIRVQAENGGVPSAEIVRFENDGAATIDEQT